mmetsp:Transcript_25694/g.74320  ORF Transcript_25694/g.74320 Transcript_25694/m.74320 type:complete len:257 (-) Transcript_25694:108-878(-)
MLSTASSGLVRILHHHDRSDLIAEIGCLALRVGAGTGIGSSDRPEPAPLSQIRRVGGLVESLRGGVLVVLFVIHIRFDQRRGGAVANEAVPDIILIVVAVVVVYSSSVVSLGLGCSSAVIDDVLRVVVAIGLGSNDLLCVVLFGVSVGIGRFCSAIARNLRSGCGHLVMPIGSLRCYIRLLLLWLNIVLLGCEHFLTEGLGLGLHGISSLPLLLFDRLLVCVGIGICCCCCVILDPSVVVPMLFLFAKIGGIDKRG